MQLDSHQERDWKRAQRWADCCTRGDCKYATNDPEHYRGEGCPGYHCTLHMEETRAVLRYRNCWRKTAWWKREQERVRANKTPTKLVRRPSTDET